LKANTNTWQVLLFLCAKYHHCRRGIQAAV
jgi:hypothetical protein